MNTGASLLILVLGHSSFGAQLLPFICYLYHLFFNHVVAYADADVPRNRPAPAGGELVGTLECSQAASPCHYIPTKEQSIKHGDTELLDIHCDTSHITGYITLHITAYLEWRPTD